MNRTRMVGRNEGGGGQNGARNSFIENGVRCTKGSRVSQSSMDVQCNTFGSTFVKLKFYYFLYCALIIPKAIASPVLD